MVSKKDIKDLDFTTLHQYMEYVVDSYINGNHSQVENLIKKMSNIQKANFLIHLDSEFVPSEIAKELKLKTYKLL